jgi:predicted acyltransferase
MQTSTGSVSSRISDILPESMPASPLPAKPPRLVSLDALRGFDMCWIMGLDLFFRAAGESFDAPWLKWMGRQMTHPDWEGFTFYDLIFPLFLFVSGVTIPLALLPKLERGVPKWKLHGQVFRRMILLVVLGIIYNGGLALRGWGSTRFGSVLGIIGIAYFFAAVIVLNCRPRWQAAWLLAVLLGCWAALTWIPVPGYGAGAITPEGSMSAWIDQHFMPGKLARRTYDAVGILPTISAISTALIGALTGNWLRRADRTPAIKFWGLLVGGAIFLGLGCLWGQSFPIIKNLWTGSYVLVTAGLSLLLLGAFYLVIDVLGYKKWTFVFVVVGMNSITIYMAGRIIDFQYTTNFLFGGFIHLAPEKYAPLLLYAAVVIIKWWFLYFLYRKKIFLRL